MFLLSLICQRNSQVEPRGLLDVHVWEDAFVRWPRSDKVMGVDEAIVNTIDDSNSKQRDKRRQAQVEPYKTSICNTFFFFKGERASYDV